MFVIIRQIDSWHFQIFVKDEYWQIPYVKLNSHNYSSIYVRMLENVTNIRYSPILGHSLRPWSKWTANSDKKYIELNGAALNVKKPCVNSQKTAFPKDK